MLEQQCPAKVLRRKTKTYEVKCGLASCSALNIPVVWQWRWWAKSNWLSLSLLPKRRFYPPWLSRTQTAYTNCLATSPPPSLNANWGSRGRTLAGNQQTSGFTVLCVKRTREKHLVCLFNCLSVWSIDHPTTIALPEIAVRDYLFGEPHLFFKWPYLSLKKMRHLGTMGAGIFFFSFWF